MKKTNNMFDLNKKNKEWLKIIFNILGIGTTIIAAFVVISQFFVYVYDIQWFYY